MKSVTKLLNKNIKSSIICETTEVLQLFAHTYFPVKKTVSLNITNNVHGKHFYLSQSLCMLKNLRLHQLNLSSFLLTFFFMNHIVCSVVKLLVELFHLYFGHSFWLITLLYKLTEIIIIYNGIEVHIRCIF